MLHLHLPLMLLATTVQGLEARPVPPTDELLGGLRLSEARVAREVRRRVQEAELGEPFSDLLARLAALADSADAARLQAVSLAFREPFQLPALCEHAAEGMEASAGQVEDPSAALRTALGRARELLDAGPTRAEPLRLEAGLAPQAHMDAIQALVERAHADLERAFAALSAEELQHVSDHWSDLHGRFDEHIYLVDDPDGERGARNLRTVSAGARVDRGALVDAALTLAALADPAWLQALATDLEAAGLDLGQPVVLERATPLGRIVVAGRGDDVHRTGDQSSEEGFDTLPAVLIDLGGDDLYASNQGATVNQRAQPVLPLAVLVDVSGNDAYESTHAMAQGAGLLGVGLLVDMGGDDSYIGTRWAQGAAFLGVGALVDVAGDDVYRAHTLSQGVGLWGVGLLLDGAGDDRYEGHRTTQGVGLAGGVGALADADGDDSYYCKGTWPTGYGTAGVFEGWGQGCGVGFRSTASGGLGLLVDGGGSDRYEAGNFSQGGGYYYALGVLCDRGRDDDVYIGSRYDQGFSAHQALGYFHESGGDDVYRTRNAVISGLAWDQSISFFLEDSGDDDYHGGGFSTGASAHNALTVFVDERGTDVHRRGAPGRAGPNDYHGGTSLSFFLDDGGQRDRYADADRNDKVEVAGEHAILVDR